MGTSGNFTPLLKRLPLLLALFLAALPAFAQIARIDVEADEADDTAIPPLTVSRETPRTEKPAALPSRPLRLLLGYTPRALTDFPDIHAAARQIVSQINLTLANSNVALTVELAGMDRVDYTEAADETSGSMLNAVTIGTGDFARLAALRQVVKADLVMVMAHWVYDNNCGRGWQLDTLDNGTTSLAEAARFGISVLSTDGANCATVRSAPHEIGHNLGAAHDRYVTPNAAPGPGSYNYGFADVAARVRDMMAYANECTAQGVRCIRLFIYADPEILHNGRPLGVPVTSPKAAAAARRIREIAPYVTQFRDTLKGNANMLAVLTTGQGAVSGPSIDCGPVCSAEYVENASITLTARAATGWRLAGWGGACTGLGPCTISMNGGKTATAAFIPSLHVGSVTTASALRFANTGTTAGRAVVHLTNPVTGADLGRWTSPVIAPNASRDFSAGEIMRNIVPGTPLPATYAVTVEPEFMGTVQHVTPYANLSTCDAGVTSDPTHLSQVSAASTIVVAQSVRGNDAINSGNHDAAAVTLGVFDARDGTRLGAYTTPLIPRNGQLMIAATDLERTLAVRAPAYTIAVESAFSGYLQHLVTSAGVVADMTTACAFEAPAPIFDTSALIQPGPVFSAGAGGQSYLRFFNTGTAAGTVNVTLADTATGRILGQWTSPAIAPNAARQFPLSEIDAGLPARLPSYTALVQTQIAGTLQHVLWRADGTLTNASTCDVGVSASATQAANVHSPLIAGYASSIVLTNTGTAAASATLGLYDAATGQRRGSYVTAPVPGGGQLTLAMAQLQTGLSAPAGGVLHYVVKIENAFPGFLQHLVNNTGTGIVSDLTAACALPAASIRYELCDRASPCALAAGTSVAGQLKSQYLTDNYRVALTAGRAVAIEIKARDSGAGTLFAPRLMIYGADPVTPLVNVITGGAGRDVRYAFTPPSTGSYTIVVSARESGYSNEDDFQVINPTMGTYRISITP